MATYSGIVDLKGTIGNLSFYKRKGVNCVRRPGGFTKEQLQTDPRLRRVREHNAEFSAQSMASLPSLPLPGKAGTWPTSIPLKR